MTEAQGASAATPAAPPAADAVPATELAATSSADPKATTSVREDNHGVKQGLAGSSADASTNKSKQQEAATTGTPLKREPLNALGGPPKRLQTEIRAASLRPAASNRNRKDSRDGGEDCGSSRINSSSSSSRISGSSSSSSSSSSSNSNKTTGPSQVYRENSSGGKEGARERQGESSHERHASNRDGNRFMEGNSRNPNARVDHSHPETAKSGSNRPSQREVYSIEEVERKRKEAEEPKRIAFVSKKEREARQQQQQQAEAEQLKRREREMLNKRREFLQREEIERERERRERQKKREMERVKEEQDRRLREEQLRQQREQERQPQKSKEASVLADLKLLNLPEQELRAKQQAGLGFKVKREKELEQIRMHYLGMKKEKKKIQKPSEKFRNIFNFEWDASEDTMRGDNNPLYQNRLEPQLLFGRGFRAGMDIREQRKANNFYDELVKRRQEYELKQRERGAEEAAAAATAAAEAAKASEKKKAMDLEEEPELEGHWSTKKREEMTERDWRIFREDFEIYLKGGRVPPPIRTWAEAELPWELIEAVKQANYERPTPIQMQAIPIALEMRDLIGIAETGSGKTAAFVLPMLTYVKQLPSLTEETSQDGPYALILAPSRELALQIEEETQKFASFCSCRSVAVVGGRSAENQAFLLRQGVEIVIGTPGRVRDCLERAYTVLNQCNYVVLDEADRMIDLGFEEVVNAILDAIPTTNLKSQDEALALQQELQAKAGHRLYRLTQMFSATMPPALERLARKYLRAPSYISIGDPGAGKRAIEQRVEFISEARKKQRLQELLEESEPPVMVFVNQKKSADALAKALSKLGFSTIALHGGKAQENREAALSFFKEGSYDVLVATDVAGRGIDVEGVRLVVNFDMPKEIEQYLHRIGRTGRAGKKGLAISFLTEEDSGIYFDLVKVMRSANCQVPLELQNHPASKVKGGNKDSVPPKPMHFY
ncbi:DEAD-box ATP-dependent RNA helicase 21 [Cyclospora cayetanensis]|uniref:RNA helicase n=1 Tax=Cyclospora cayetanensis TaxID=88456 RepID=A0A6P6RX84_9EIME|nr:DEAD-box ATP-dependent RNA helicase 21 [Cyclospora cayetanensis]